MIICVGIDIHKRVHQVAILDEFGKPVGKSFKIKNTREGFDELMARVCDANPNQLPVRFGMEATGHYWLSLHAALVEQEYEVIVFNPLRTIAYRNLQIRPVKNDRIDARCIAEIVDAVGELLGLLNGYSYANSNPVNMTDPSGMFAVPSTIQSPSSLVSFANDGACSNNVQNPPSNQPGGCKIEIAGLDVIPAGPAGAGHLLLIFTTEIGTEYEYRAGPKIHPSQHPTCSNDYHILDPLGSLCATSLEFIPTIGVDAQFAELLDLRRSTLMVGPEACEKRRCLDYCRFSKLLRKKRTNSGSFVKVFARILQSYCEKPQSMSELLR